VPAEMLGQPRSIPVHLHRGRDAQLQAVPERGIMEDPIVDMLAWLFVKTEEEIVDEAEVAALHSMFLAEDPRPERAV